MRPHQFGPVQTNAFGQQNPFASSQNGPPPPQTQPFGNGPPPPQQQPFGNGAPPPPPPQQSIAQQQPFGNSYSNGAPPPPPPSQQQCQQAQPNAFVGQYQAFPASAPQPPPPPPAQQSGYGGSGGRAQPTAESLHAELNARAQEFNCGSQFIRTTMSRIPQSLMTKQKLGVPLGAVIQPLSQNLNTVVGAKPCQHVNPVVDQVTGRSQTPLGSIIRCKKCRTYINPYVVWECNGRRWKCNICGFGNECAQMYYAPIDEATGRRVDLHDRPELSQGGVEFYATPDYISRPAQPPVYLFLIEVTQRAIQSGYVAEVCASAKEAINKLIAQTVAQQENGSSSTFQPLCGVITFDSSIHYYNLKPELGFNPQMVVLSDLDDLFLPMPDDVLLNVMENKDAICGLLDTLPNLFRDTKVTESCLGAALKGCILAMRHFGGKVSAFACTCPTLGNDGRCNPNREAHALRSIGMSVSTANGPGISAAAAQGQDKGYDQKEASLLRAINEDYKDLAGRMITFHMSVDLYIAPIDDTYFDLATIKLVAQYTGGDIYYYDHFTPQQHGRKIREELTHSLTRYSGLEAVMRIRVSQGWIIRHFFGHMYIRGSDLLTIPNCQCDYTSGIMVEMEDGVSVVDHQIHFQIALLYTTVTGDRKIRILTYALTATQNYNELVQSVDPQVTTTVLSMLAADRALRSSLGEARGFLTSTIHQIVSHNSSIQDQKGNFQYLPLYVFGLLKSPAFRPGIDMTADRRTSTWCRLSNICLEKCASLFVPRLIALHDMSDGHGVMNENGQVMLPEKLSLTANSLLPTGCYLIENGFQIVVFVGQEIDPNFLEQLFGVRTVQELPLDGQVTEDEILTPSGSPLKDRFLNIIEAIRKEVDVPYMAVSLTCQGRLDNAERKFWEMMIEDKGSGLALSYSEFEARMKQGSMAPGMIR